MSYAVRDPRPLFYDQNGSPLDDGRLYFGTAGSNPRVESNRMSMFWDAAKTVRAAQPVPVRAGMPQRNGIASKLYADLQDYSIEILGRHCDRVHLDLNASAAGGSGGTVGDVSQTATDAAALARSIGLVGDGITDDAPALAAYLEKLADSGVGGEVVLMSPVHASLDIDSLVETGVDRSTFSFYFGDSVDLGSYTHLSFLSPVRRGEFGRIRAFGTAREQDLGTHGSGRISQPIAAGDEWVYLDGTHNNSNTAVFSLGAVVVLRGQNGVTGAAINRPDRKVIVEVDAALNRFRVDSPLSFDYDPTYPDSEYVADGLDPTDRTTISKIVSSRLLQDQAHGSNSIYVDNPSLFSVGDVVLLQDVQTVSDYVDDLQPDTPPVTASSNPIRREVMRVSSVGTSTITFEKHLSHDYKRDHWAHVQLLDPVRGSSINGATITNAFTATAETSRNHHSISLEYAVDCTIYNCHVGPGGVSQAFRVNIGYNCAIEHCSAAASGFSNSGQGYGATLYAATACRIHDFTGVHLRHDILLFSGACQNIITNIVSIGTLISAVDLHGAFENDNLIDGVICVGGSRSTTDQVNDRSAVKLGNTYHLAGSHRNTVRNVLVVNYNGTDADGTPSGTDSRNWRAIEILATSSGNVVSEVVGHNCEYGIFCRDLARNGNGNDSQLYYDDNVIENCTFYDTTRNSIYVNNQENVNVGASSSYFNGRRLSIDNFRDYRSQDGVHIEKAQNCQLSNFKSYFNQANTAHALTFKDCAGCSLIDSWVEGGNRGVEFLGDSTNFTADNVRFKALGGGTVATFEQAPVGLHWDCKYINMAAPAFAGVDIVQSTASTVRHNIKNRVVEVSQVSAALTGSIPYDDTYPADTEGDVVINTDYTPTAPTSRLVVRAYVPHVGVTAATQTTITATLWHGGAGDDGGSLLDVTSRTIIGGSSQAGAGAMTVIEGVVDRPNNSTRSFTLRMGHSGEVGSEYSVHTKYGSAGMPSITIDQYDYD